jgi:predicted PurR-regulated permease PerM
VFWAVILAIVFRPLSARCCARSASGAASRLSQRAGLRPDRHPAPMTLIGVALLNEGARVLQTVQDASVNPPANLAEAFAHLPPWAQQAFDRFGLGDLEDVRTRLASFAGVAGQFLAAQALAVGQNALGFLVSLGIMLYVLFFLFRDGLGIGRNIRAACRSATS